MFKYHTKNHKMIDYFTLLVKDIDRSLKFYKESLGLDLVSQEGNNYNLGVGNKVLFTITTNDKVIPKVRTTGLYHFALLLPKRSDLGNLLHHFLKTGQIITGGSDHGVSEALYLNDPDMNGIEIYVDYPDNKWPRSSANTVDMVSDPLDYENLLLNRSSDEPFKMPEGTIIGHMHYHVNNLLKGKEFFINIIGFELAQNAGSALFVSDDNYHHHLGFNVWNGLNAINRSENMVGLVDYHLNVNENEIEDFINNLKDNNYEILDDEKGRYIYDINEVKLYF